MHKRQKKRSIASTSTKRRKRKKRLPRAAVYTLQERWDLPRVRELVDRLPSDHRDLKILTHVSTHADPVSGLLAVDYYYSQNRASGRLYASNSCQRLSRPVRSFCTQDRYIDLDIRKSFPTMLLRICEDNGLDPQKLGNYTTRGDDVINGILDEQKQAEGRTPLVYEDVKKAFLVSLHCGDYRSLITQGRQVDELEEFAAEMKEVATELYTRSRYKSVRDHVEAQKGRNENKLGSFISFLCQDKESIVIEAARTSLEEQGFIVRVNMYDGLMVDQENIPRVCDREFLRSLDDAVLQTTACRVEFVEKSIKKYTVEEVCIPSAAAAITPTDKVVLFGLEGTLVTRGLIRPGAKEQLELLQKGAIKIGVFTDEPKRRVSLLLETLQNELGVKFDFFLTGERCYPTGEWTEENKKQNRKKHKSLSHHFPNTQNVVFIDTEPELVAEKDRSRVWTWEEEEKRGWTFKTPHHREGLTLSSYLKVTKVVAKTVYMLDDPAMNPDTITGKASLEKWKRTAVLTGPQGVGKSFAALDIIRVTLQPDNCCVILAPSRALARQIASDLKVHLTEKVDERKVLLYLETDSRGQDAGDWDFLVVGPLSLGHHLPQFAKRTLGVVVADELPELRQMLATFLEADAKALEDTRIGVAYVMDIAKKVLLISAQMQNDDIKWATDMMTTEIRGKQEILIFDSDHIPRETVTWKVKDGAHLRNLIGGYIDKGKRVVCFAETVEMANNLKEWFEMKYQEHQPRKRALSFTAEVSNSLSTSVSEHGEGCDFFVYTSALGLGMNLTPTFDVRFMIADAGFTSAKRLAQLAGRPRNCLQPDLFVCIGQSMWRTMPGDGPEEMARNKVMFEYQESLVPTIVNGKLERTLPDTAITLARLQLARAAIEESDPGRKLDRLHYWSDCARHKGEAPGYHSGHQNDEYWERIVKHDKLRQAWNTQAVYLNKDEVTKVGFEMLEKKAVGDDVAMTVTNYKVINCLMPYMVGSASKEGAHALNKDLLFDLRKDNNYTKLYNFIALAAGTDVEGERVFAPGGVMFPAWKMGNTLNAFGTEPHECALAILLACGPSLQVDIGVKRRSMRVAEQKHDIFTLHEVTPQQQQKAYNWIATHWELRLAPKKGVPVPVFGGKDWWRYVRCFMRETIGVGVVQTQKGVQGPHTHRLVTSTVYKKHDIDLIQVARGSRTRAVGTIDGPVLHNGRPFGLMSPKVRKCDQCPTNRPATMCVRQYGTQWLCMATDPRDGYSARCHRNYHTPIDVGYLDREVPNSDRDDAIQIEEIVEQGQEERETHSQRRAAVLDTAARLPPTHKKLIRDLGFVDAVCEVTAEKMQCAWEDATDVEYLKVLDKNDNSKLYTCAKNGGKMKQVRQMVKCILHVVDLRLVRTRRSVAGVRGFVYIISTSNIRQNK